MYRRVLFGLSLTLALASCTGIPPAGPTVAGIS
jgi:hypothetical protein